MLIERLALENWRSARREEVAFAPGLTLLTGENAQGKTNLLEAVYFLASGHSHRTSRDRELIAFGATTARLVAEIRRASGSFQLQVVVRESRTERQRNGKAFRRGQDPLGDFRAVLFAPEDLIALKGAPAERRRLLDQDLGQASAAYRSAWTRYSQVLRQRNALLRSAERPPRELMAPWDAAWADAALALRDLRSRAVSAVEPIFRRESQEIAGAEPCTLAYEPSLQAEDHASAIDEIRAKGHEEMRRRTTLLGPHRDDLRIEIAGRDLRLFGSQGEQRTALVAFKLAVTELLSSLPGGSPVLLLDDVLSELDKDRRRRLLEGSGRTQTVVTTTEPELAGMRPEAVYRVRAGHYERT